METIANVYENIDPEYKQMLTRRLSLIKRDPASLKVPDMVYVTKVRNEKKTGYFHFVIGLNMFATIEGAISAYYAHLLENVEKSWKSRFSNFRLEKIVYCTYSPLLRAELRFTVSPRGSKFKVLDLDGKEMNIENLSQVEDAFVLEGYVRMLQNPKVYEPYECLVVEQSFSVMERMDQFLSILSRFYAESREAFLSLKSEYTFSTPSVPTYYNNEFFSILDNYFRHHYMYSKAITFYTSLLPSAVRTHVSTIVKTGAWPSDISREHQANSWDGNRRTLMELEFSIPISRFLLLSGRKDEAIRVIEYIREFHKTMAIEPVVPTVLFQLSYIEILGDAGKEREMLSQSIRFMRRYPYLPDGIILRSRAHCSLNNLSAGIGILNLINVPKEAEKEEEFSVDKKYKKTEPRAARNLLRQEPLPEGSDKILKRVGSLSLRKGTLRYALYKHFVYILITHGWNRMNQEFTVIKRRQRNEALPDPLLTRKPNQHIVPCEECKIDETETSEEGADDQSLSFFEYEESELFSSQIKDRLLNMILEKRKRPKEDAKQGEHIGRERLSGCMYYVTDEHWIDNRDSTGWFDEMIAILLEDVELFEIVKADIKEKQWDLQDWIKIHKFCKRVGTKSMVKLSLYGVLKVANWQNRHNILSRYWIEMFRHHISETIGKAFESVELVFKYLDNSAQKTVLEKEVDLYELRKALSFLYYRFGPDQIIEYLGKLPNNTPARQRVLSFIQKAKAIGVDVYWGGSSK